MSLTRRASLLAAGGLVGAAVAGCGREEPLPVLPSAAPGRLVSGSFVSAARGGRRTGWSVAYPPGASPGTSSGVDLPVAVFLHGRYQDHRTAFGTGRRRLGLDRFLAAQRRRGGAAYAIASVDGGDSYWHRRPSGEDAGTMVLDELLPLLARRGLRTGPSDRIALTGLSMGGYGALRLAGLLGRERVAVVAVMSPALWTDPAAASTAGFADAAEYRRYSVLGHQRDLTGIPVRIDCGEDDPFHDATRAYARVIPGDPVVRFEPGAHDLAFWRRHAPAQLAFVARHLVRDPVSGG